MITHTAQAKNAVKWIDSLKGGKKGFKKGIEALGTFTYGESILKHLDVIFVPPVAEMVKKHYGK
jgi:hypothetical protein